MKVGRNEPCPCGSGLKQKKCCLSPHPKEEVRSRPRAAVLDLATADLGAARSHSEASRFLEAQGLKHSPYAIARLFERTESSVIEGDLRALLTRGRRPGWTMASVAALTAEQLEERLRRYGVDPTPGRFLELAGRVTSAWDVAELWIQQGAQVPEPEDEDFLGFAACILWTQLRSDHPSMEMLDDWMQEGYRFYRTRNMACACETWLKVWGHLRSRFAPDMVHFDRTLFVFSGTEFLSNFCRQLADALEEAVRVDAATWAAAAIRYYRELLVQFIDEDEDFRISMHRNLAECLMRSGEGLQAEAVLVSLATMYPNNVWTYVALIDAYSGLFRSFSLEVKLERARFWLSEAYRQDLVNKDSRQILEDRSGTLEEKSAKAA